MKVPLSCNEVGQVVHTHAHLSQGSILQFLVFSEWIMMQSMFCYHCLRI